jgi:hypothetical protein
MREVMVVWTYYVSGGNEKYMQIFGVEISYTRQSKTHYVDIMGTLWAFVITIMSHVNPLQHDRYFLNN